MNINRRLQKDYKIVIFFYPINCLYFSIEKRTGIPVMKILVIEDEKKVASFIKKGLES